jgi:hypothetical protein
MTSALIARATIADPAKRQAYGDWHSKHVFNEAIKDMSSHGLIAARRGWSLTSPEIHISAYWFADEASMKAAVEQVAPKYVEILEKEFPDVTRTLEQTTTAEEWTKGMAEAAAAAE